jgi:hypothetical protein
MFTLNKRYLSRANIHDNPLIKKLVEEYRRGFDGGQTITKPTLLCADRVALDDYFKENDDDDE